MAKRLLVIEKLVVAIPDDFIGTDHPDRPELTINDALRFLLNYRESHNAVIENQFGNFEYTAMDFPHDTIPEGEMLETTFTKEKLLEYLTAHPEKSVAGAIFSLIYDEELGGYRNCYRGTEQAEFEKKKQYLMTHGDNTTESSADEQDTDESHENNPCKNCECICDENCPDLNRITKD